MKRILASAALAAILSAPAFAQQPPTDTVPSSSVTAEGSVRVEGVAPDKVLGAIDTKALVDGAKAPDAEPPAAKTQVTVETKTEVIEPVSDRPTLDPSNPIAPEVKAVVDGKARYSTDDLAQAQLAAVLATPASIPTTVITTTTTTPKADR